MERVYTGIDIIEIERIRESILRWQGRFLTRIFTDRELSLYENKLDSLAARFAGKEAVMKALNAMESGIAWRDIEILSDDHGKPVVNLYARAQEQMQSLGLTGLEISLSHSRENAIALVIGLRER